MLIAGYISTCVGSACRSKITRDLSVRFASLAAADKSLPKPPMSVQPLSLSSSKK